MTRSEVQVPHRPPIRGVLCLVYCLKVMSVYFVRHGESLANKEGFLAGQMDTPITSKGLDQARAAGEALRLSDVRIDRIISSPLKRAHETAIEIARLINYPIDNITIDNDLMERNMGTFQGQPIASKSLMNKMFDNEQEGHGIETLSMLRRRAQNVLNAIDQSDENILLVSHNGLGRSLVSVIHGVDFHHTKRLPNAKVIDLQDNNLVDL
jgi:broad specificity phosphatase PhoE